METILGSSIAAFIVLTVIVFGTCAFLTGQTLAEGWKPESTLYGYILLLGLLGLVTDQLMRAAERVLFRYNRRRR